MEVDQHKDLHPYHHAEYGEEEEEEKGLVLLSQVRTEVEKLEGETGEAGTLGVPLQ